MCTTHNVSRFGGEFVNWAAVERHTFCLTFINFHTILVTIFLKYSKFFNQLFSCCCKYSCVVHEHQAVKHFYQDVYKHDKQEAGG